MQDQQASLDFAYAAIGRVAEVAKRIIAEHYGKPPDKSYFAGCSTGGREAMMMTQRYPLQFDGVISGAPAMRTAFSGIGDRWVAATLNEIAPKNAKGQPVTRDALSESDKKTVIDGIVNACDAGDGVKDGMVFNINACKFDPKTLVCKGAKADGCLSMAQATTLEKAFAGPKDSKGRQVYPGFLFDTGIASTQGIAGLLHGGQLVGGGAARDRDGRRRCGREGAGRSGREPEHDVAVDQPEYVLRPRRQADLLAWRERPVVLGARHGGLLRAHDEGERRAGAGAQLEPPVHGPGRRPLRRRTIARHVRCAHRDRELG